MPFCQWSETMSVGESLLDADHKSLVLLINRLHDSLEAGEDRLRNLMSGNSEFC
jgi:hemerythrin